MAQLKLNITATTAEATAQIKALNASITSMVNSLKNSPINKDLTAQMNAYARAINAASKATRNQLQEEKLRTQEAKTALETAKKQTETAKQQTEAIKQQARLANKYIDYTKRGTEATKESTKATEDHRKSILELARSFLEYQIAASLIMKPIYKLREAFEDLNETLVKTEDHMVILKRVIGNGDMQKMANELYDIAIKYGQDIENVWEVAENFAKSGLSWVDTLKATEAGVLALNVAEMSAEEASNGLIAVMNQFGYKAEDLTDIIDILNKTANSAPVTTQKLLQALQKTGSYAQATNLSLQETVSLITAISGSTGVSGQQLGTALKSILAYTTKSKSLELYSALSPNMSAVVEEYRKGAASILDVWRRLSAELKHLSSEQQKMLQEYMLTPDGQALNDELAASIGEEMEDLQDGLTGVYDTAGTYRKNYFIALMNNFDAVEKALKNLDDYQGYSEQKNAEYMESYTASVKTLTDEWQKMANDEQGLLGFKKALVEVGINLINIVNAVGGVKSAVLTLMTILASLFGTKVVDAFKKAGHGIKEYFTSIKLATQATKLQKQAEEAAAAATEARAYATKICSDASRDGAEKAVALSMAEKAEAQAAETAAAAQKAHAASINWVVAIIMAAITVITIVTSKIKQAEEEQEAARDKLIETGKAAQETQQKLVNLLNTLNSVSKEDDAFETAERELAKQLGITRGEIEKNTSAYDDYIAKIKEATIARLKYMAQEAAATAAAAKKKLNDEAEEDIAARGTGGQKTHMIDAFEQYKRLGERIAALYEYRYYTNPNGEIEDMTEWDTYKRDIERRNELESIIQDYISAVVTSNVLSALASGKSVMEGGLLASSEIYGLAKGNTDATKLFSDFFNAEMDKWYALYGNNEQPYEGGGTSTTTTTDKTKTAIQNYLAAKAAVDAWQDDTNTTYYQELTSSLDDATKKLRDEVVKAVAATNPKNYSDMLTATMGALGMDQGLFSLLFGGLTMSEFVDQFMAEMQSPIPVEDEDLEKYNKETVSILKEIRSAANTISEIEERRQELLNAERQLDTKVYNAETGQFELAASPSKVATARENLTSSLRKAAEQDIYDKIESGEFTLGELLGIIDKYNEFGLLDENGWASQLRDDILGVYATRYPSMSDWAEYELAHKTPVATTTAIYNNDNSVTYQTTINGVNFYSPIDKTSIRDVLEQAAVLEEEM